MDAAVTAIVGLGGAIIGATVSYLGLSHIERQRAYRTRVGMVRALISELMQNAAAVIQVLYRGSPVTEFSFQTWRSARFELGQFLNTGLYEDIDFIYLTLPTISRLPGPTNQEEREVLEQWLDRIKKAIHELWELPVAADFRRSQHKFHQWLELKEKEPREKVAGTGSETRS